MVQVFGLSSLIVCSLTYGIRHVRELKLFEDTFRCYIPPNIVDVKPKSGAVDT